jgi:carbon-monoxide dehydrogenase small subunit
MVSTESPTTRSVVEGEIVCEMVVNGEPMKGVAEPRTLLVDFLRHELGLTGTHVGCEHGVCGACTILVDDQPVRSCLLLAVQARGA